MHSNKPLKQSTQPTIKGTTHSIQHTHGIHAHSILQQLALRIQQARAVAQHARLYLTPLTSTHWHEAVRVALQMHHEAHHVLSAEDRRAVVVVHHHA